MKRLGSSVRWLVSCFTLAGAVLAVAESASAQQVVRVAKYTLADKAKLPELFKVTDEINALYTRSFAFQWLKLFYDPETNECIGMSLWESRAGLSAAVEADAFKGLLDRVKPLTKGDFSARTYQVYQPKKP